MISIITDFESAHFGLTNNQWKQLTAIVALPNTAKGSIEVAMSLFRRSLVKSKSNVSPATAKSVLRRTAAAAKKTAKLILKLGGSEVGDALFGAKQLLENDYTFDRLTEDIEVRAEQLNHFAAWCELAAKGIHPKRSGADVTQFRFFVLRIDRLLLKFTGEGLTSTKKRSQRGLFLELLLKICEFPASTKSIYDATSYAVTNRQPEQIRR